MFPRLYDQRHGLHTILKDLAANVPLRAKHQGLMISLSLMTVLLPRQHLLLSSMGCSERVLVIVSSHFDFHQHFLANVFMIVREWPGRQR